jgi:hypothetical protein
MTEDQLKNVDKNIAFILELIGGLFGFLGIGYMYAGEIKGGVMRLLLWFALLYFSWIVASILSIILIGLCLMPFIIVAQVGIPIWSAFELKKRLEEAFPET